MRDHHAKEPLGQFAAQLLVEIEADCDVLAKLIERRGAVSGGVKEMGRMAGGESEPAETETELS